MQNRVKYINPQDFKDKISASISIYCFERARAAEASERRPNKKVKSFKQKRLLMSVLMTKRIKNLVAKAL
jgi:hypothetical protein